MDGILESFCTVPATKETDSDRRLVEGAAVGTVAFDDRTLVTYTWGSGPGVLLGHGWGSRASHMGLIARGLARAGFRAVAFDGPAHGRSREHGGSPLSNGFEFARALHAVEDAAGPFAAVVGHSISAAAAAWASAGLGALSEYRLRAGSLVLISAPAGINELLESWCRSCRLDWRELKRELEREFACDTDRYGLAAALQSSRARVLMIHDEGDEEAPVAGAVAASRAAPGTGLVLTRGFGHGRILGAREPLREILSFLAGT
jgi:pimeloyl-ACP methyl ester carboxylesterase